MYNGILGLVVRLTSMGCCYYQLTHITHNTCIAWWGCRRAVPAPTTACAIQSTEQCSKRQHTHTASMRTCGLHTAHARTQHTEVVHKSRAVVHELSKGVGTVIPGVL